MEVGESITARQYHPGMWNVNQSLADNIRWNVNCESITARQYQGGMWIVNRSLADNITVECELLMYWTAITANITNKETVLNQAKSQLLNKNTMFTESRDKVSDLYTAQERSTALVSLAKTHKPIVTGTVDYIPYTKQVSTKKRPYTRPEGNKHSLLHISFQT